MKYKALFLDLDGTILNTLYDIAGAVNYALKKHKLPERSLDEVLSYIGHGSDYLIHCALGDNHQEVFQEVFDCYKKYYLENPALLTVPYESCQEVLKEFKAKGGKIALVSNKPQDISIRLLNKFYPNLFDSIHGQIKGQKVKPDPTIIDLAMKDLKISDKNSILYVGDSLVDLATANNAHIKCVLCSYGYESKDKIIATHNDYIDKFEDLKGYLFDEK